MNRLLPTACCLFLAVAAFGQESPDFLSGFDKDLAALTSRPARLAGTEAAIEAGQYVQQRLGDLGIDVYTQDFPLIRCVQTECSLTADGQAYEVFACRPNHLMGVITPPEGITAGTVYAGQGRLEDYPQDVASKIVVLDFSACERWQKAFALGAKAVVFIGQDEPAPNALHHLNMPANLPRFYVTAATAEKLKLKTQSRTLTLKAACRWDDAEGRNIIGIIKGTDSEGSRPVETLVLAAPLDSLSEVPALSPGARSAANAAGLLALAQYLKANPPKRDIVVAFFDGQSCDNAGAAAFYAAIFHQRTRPSKWGMSLTERAEMLQADRRDVTAMIEAIERVQIYADGQRHTLDFLRREAKAMAGGLREKLQLARETIRNNEQEIRRLKNPGAKAYLRPLEMDGSQLDVEALTPEQRQQRIDALAAANQRVEQEQVAPLTDEDLACSELERALNDLFLPPEGSPAADKFDLLVRQATELLRQRQQELDRLIAYSQQGQKLLDELGDTRRNILFHLSLNLADRSSRWAFVQGDDSMALFDSNDNKNVYGELFAGICKTAGAAELEGKLPGLDLRSIQGLLNMRMFVPGQFVHSGSVAGTFGVAELAVMTPMDLRPRDGQPCDVVFRTAPDGRRTRVLNTENMKTALGEVALMAKALGDSPDVNVKVSINRVPLYSEVRYDKDNHQQIGALSLLLSSASALPDRPARGAVMSLLPKTSKVESTIAFAELDKFPPGFTPYSLGRVDINGRFAMPPYNEDYYSGKAVIGALFDERGLIRFITNIGSTQTNQSLPKYNGNLVSAEMLTLVGQGYARLGATQALQASSTAPLSEDSSLVCEGDFALTVFARPGTEGVKLFNARAMVLLGNSPPADPIVGRGLLIQPYSHWPTGEMTAANMYTLIDQRLEILRANRIREESLEQLAVAAREAQEAAKTQSSVKEREGTLAASAAISLRVYDPLLEVLNDLVVAVVLLLLLALPFAFAVERLLIGTPHIYRQIAWFTVIFLVTFAVLYAVNPAFKIASTPIVIFLAFAIMLLSALVIVIMTRKLQSEIKRMQGQGTAMHASDVSRLGTMMAAVAMGISTMRRRPIRTLLTAVTVLLLTFTILTFASFSATWGVKRTYSGALTGPPRVMVRHPLWSRLGLDTAGTLEGYLGQRATVVPRFWVALTATEVKAYADASQEKQYLVGNATGDKVAGIPAMIGIDPRDLELQPELAEILPGGQEALKTGGVYLPEALAKMLDVKVGDRVVVDGMECPLAGIVDQKKLANYHMLEGSSILPVDYRSSAGGNTGTFKDRENAKGAAQGEQQSAQFMTFNQDSIIFVPAELARRLSGKISSISIYPKGGADVDQLGKDIALVTNLPTYVGSGGQVSRLMYASLTEASGWKEVIIPVVLGGLIIFATMLGSVSDREKEIYAFSALGLAPPHVASLFFAEASVYAVVGGMGGYLLGQVVSRLLGYLAETFGLALAPTMNYSSTNAIVTVLAVMFTVLVSTIYPAVKASRSANPGIQRHWRLGKPTGDLYDIVFPFTVSAYDIAGVTSFLREHFENFSDTAMGSFTARQVRIFRQTSGLLGIEAEVALRPYDLGVSQKVALLAQPSEIEGIQEIRILLRRLSGTEGDWQRANHVFVHELRKQLLIWRSIAPEAMERYRAGTLEQLEQLPRQEISPQTFGVPA